MSNEQSTWSADDKAHVSPRGVTAPGVPSASKHTPGPWRTKRGMDQMCDSGTTVASIVDAPNGPRWWIFSDAENHGDAEADARLIASAPALVSALEELLAADAVQMPFAEEGIEAQDAWANRRAAAREAARHALRLARGGRT